MRARLVWCVAVLLVIGAENTWSEEAATPEAATPESAQVATCPTVLPEAAGERSVVVPTLAPQVAAPRVASRPVPAVPAAQALLSEKLAERDRLQREISALQESTKTPEQILVRVKMLEVNLTKLRQLGVDWSKLIHGQPETLDVAALLESGAFSNDHTPSRAGQGAAQAGGGLPSFFDALEHQNLAKVLAEPSVVTTSGRPASLCVGGEFPVPVSAEDGGVKIQKYGTQLDVTAVSLGDNRVRLNVRPRVSQLDTSRGIVVKGQQVPALTVRECDFSSETEFGKSVVLSGLVQERTEASADPSGRIDERVQEIALVVVVTPEIVR